MEEKEPSKVKLVDSGKQPVPTGKKGDVDYGPGYKPAGDKLPEAKDKEYSRGKQSSKKGRHSNQNITKTSSTNNPGYRGSK